MRVSQSSPVASKHSSNENKKIASSAYTAAVIVTRLSPPELIVIERFMEKEWIIAVTVTFYIGMIALIFKNL